MSPNWKCGGLHFAHTQTSKYNKGSFFYKPSFFKLLFPFSLRTNFTDYMCAPWGLGRASGGHGSIFLCPEDEVASGKSSTPGRARGLTCSLLLCGSDFTSQPPMFTPAASNEVCRAHVGGGTYCDRSSHRLILKASGGIGQDAQGDAGSVEKDTHANRGPVGAQQRLASGQLKRFRQPPRQEPSTLVFFLRLPSSACPGPAPTPLPQIHTRVSHPQGKTRREIEAGGHCILHVSAESKTV